MTRFEIKQIYRINNKNLLSYVHATPNWEKKYHRFYLRFFVVKKYLTSYYRYNIKSKRLT